MTRMIFPLALVGVASVGALAGLSLPSSKAPGTPVQAVRFGLCHGGGGTNCVVDGDTLWVDGIKIRVADIDAPETHDPKCGSEAELGRKATLRLHALVNAGAFSLTASRARDEDRHGRKLRILTRDGTSLGDVLVDEGLARRWEGRRRSWC